MQETTSIKKGMYILYHDEPHYIVEAEFYSPGKGSALTRVKLKNLNTNRVIPTTFKSGEKVSEIEVSLTDMQYLYSDENTLYFMNPDSYEQYTMKKELAEQYLKYMKEGEEYTVAIHQDRLIFLKFPPQVVLKVTSAPPGAKGDSANNPTKEVTIETGHTVEVPLFIKEGEEIKLDPETDSYVGRKSS